MTLISIVIISDGSQSKVMDTIESLCGQVGDIKFECLVVGFSDDSSLPPFAQDLSIRFVPEEWSDLCRLLRSGAAELNARTIGVLDAGTRLEPGALEMVANLRSGETPAELVISPGNVNFAALLDQLPCAPSAAFFDRELFFSVGPWWSDTEGKQFRLALARLLDRGTTITATASPLTEARILGARAVDDPDLLRRIFPELPLTDADAELLGMVLRGPGAEDEARAHREQRDQSRRPGQEPPDGHAHDRTSS